MLSVASQLANARTATDLVPGSPSSLWADSDGYAARAEELLDAAIGVGKLETGTWTGEAAEAFQASQENLAARLNRAAQCCAVAAGALSDHAATLRWAQREAADAIVDYDRASVCTPGTNPLTNPPTPGQQDAVDRLTDARTVVARSAEAAAKSLEEAANRAARSGGFWNDVGKQWSHFWHGAAEPTADIVGLAWSESTMTMLTDPDGWWQTNQGLLAGLWYEVQDPEELGKSVVDWHTWSNDPARAAGHLVPDVLLALVTAGAGAAATRSATAAAVIAEGAAEGSAAAGIGLTAADAATATAAATSDEALAGMEDLLRGLARGRSSGVRTVGSDGELGNLFSTLAQDGTPIDATGYGGAWVERLDGIRVGLREGSKSGGRTIDIRYPDGTIRKIHIQ